MNKKKLRRRAKNRSMATQNYQLEDRKMLAGDVAVAISGDTLTINGSRSADAIQVIQSEDSLTIQGVNGTTINGGDSAFVLEAGAESLNLRAFLRGGDDTLTLEGLDTSGVVAVLGNAGDDSITVSGSQIDRALFINAGRGDDAIELTDVDSSRSRVIIGGRGNDALSLGGENTSGSLRDRIASIEQTIELPDTQDDDDETDETDVFGNVSVILDGNNLVINGTSGNDGIIIIGRDNGIEVSLSAVIGNTFADGSTTQLIPIAAGALESLTINLQEGSDGVAIIGVDAPNSDLVINGGDGSDRLLTRNVNFASIDLNDLER